MEKEVFSLIRKKVVRDQGIKVKSLISSRKKLNSSNNKVKQNKLCCLLLNARSIRDIHKRNELELTVNEKKIDLIAITESWLEDTMIDSELNIAGYTIFRKDRKQVRDSRGGGVLMYVRDCFNAYYATELNDLQNESLWIRIQMSQTRFMLVGVCYKSPTAKEDEVKSMYG